MRGQRAINEIPVVSRTQRRFERRQRLVMLILVVAVTVASFFLGVMVGERGSSSGYSQQVDASYEPTVQVAPPPLPAGQYVAPQKLTFYDDLPKGNAAPLGSGINLPKAAAAPAAAPASAAAPISLPASNPAKAPAQPQPEAVKPSAPPPAPAVTTPKPSASGSFVVQVVSTRDQAEAKRLVDRLKGQGHAANFERADLGSKGIWYRVVAGPYADLATAEQAAAQLKKQKFSVMVRKR